MVWTQCNSCIKCVNVHANARRVCILEAGSPSFINCRNQYIHTKHFQLLNIIFHGVNAPMVLYLWG